MEYLLFVAYLIFFAWLITKTKFFLASGLSKAQLVIIFLLKVIAGIFYGWIGIYYGQLAQMSDTWAFHYNGIAEYNILRHNPGEYFTNIFHNPYQEGFSNFFGSENSYWNDLKSNIFIKFISIFDIFSGGYYYVNVIFYSYCVFIGPIALYRVMKDLFPEKKMMVILGVFFIPSFFYWGSGLHKEGLISMSICLILYSIYTASRNKRVKLQQVLFFSIAVLLLLVLRNVVLLLIIPAVAAWILSNRFPRYTPAIFIGVYALCLVLFFNTRYVFPGLDFPAAVVEKQKAFLVLTGQSSLPLEALEPTFVDFLRRTPQAVALSATRPYPSDVTQLLTLAAAAEIGVLVMILLIFLVYHVRKPVVSRNTLYFCLFFTASLLLAIGFTVNNLGAIARYRSIALPLVMTPLLARIDWDRFFGLFAPLKADLK